jgi:hypothetical protein
MGRRGIHAGFWWQMQMEDLDKCGSIRVKWIIRDIGTGGMDWINLAQERNQWRVLVNLVMNLHVP